MDIDTLKKKSTKLRIVFLISLIMRTINLLSVIITNILISCNIINSTSSNQTWGLIFFFLMGKIILTCVCFGNVNQINNANYQSLDEPIKWLKQVKYSCIISLCFFVVILLISLCFQQGVPAFALGYTSLGSLTFIIGGIMTFCLCGDIDYEKKVKQYGSEAAYIEALLQEKENKDNAKQQMNAEQAMQKEHDKTVRLLEEIGKKFFVKYYDKLQNWSIPDIVDEIEENYSEESKLNRIKKAKKIFELGLNNIALEIISNSENKTTDDITQNKALQLLEQTKSTDE